MFYLDAINLFAKKSYKEISQKIHFQLFLNWRSQRLILCKVSRNKIYIYFQYHKLLCKKSHTKKYLKWRHFQRALNWRSQCLISDPINQFKPHICVFASKPTCKGPKGNAVELNFGRKVNIRYPFWLDGGLCSCSEASNPKSSRGCWWRVNEQSRRTSRLLVAHWGDSIRRGM